MKRAAICVCIDTHTRPVDGFNCLAIDTTFAVTDRISDIPVKTEPKNPLPGQPKTPELPLMSSIIMSTTQLSVTQEPQIGNVLTYWIGLLKLCRVSHCSLQASSGVLNSL